MEPQYVAPAVVLIGIAARAYFGRSLFHPHSIVPWNVVRRLASSLIQQVVYRWVGDIDVENEAVRDEYVGVIESGDVTQVAKALNDVADPEVPLLAGYKTDWEDREEVGTLVFHHGPRPWPTAPKWLSRYQLHITFFYVDTPDGRQIMATAHVEANSYRPDLWVDHLMKGPSFSAREGVRKASIKFEDADLDWTPNHPAVSVDAPAEVTEA